MIVTAIAERCDAPAPIPNAVGSKPGDNRQRRHQNRPQPDAVGFHDGVVDAMPFVTQPIHVVDLQNAVLLHDAEQQQARRAR